MSTSSWKLFAIVLLLAACAKKSELPASQPTAPRPASTSAATPAAVAPAPSNSSGVVLSAPNGGRVLEASSDSSGNITIAYGNEVLRSDLRDKKRKYDTVEVKFGDDGFKVRTLDGKLLWKVKKSADKIKISNNEENKDAFELKSGDGKVKVYAPGDQLLGQVIAQSGGVTIVDASGTERFRGNGTTAAPFYGVSLLSSIPAKERAVILAELAVGR